MRGYFITLEGGEGAGKSSNIPFMIDYLRSQGIDALATREPGGTLVSEAIRGVLLDKNLPAMHPDTELLLMFAARQEHLAQKILPALAEGQWVVSDRFTDATYAYQGYGRGQKLERIQQLEQWVQGDVRPDLTLLFDIAVEVGFQRVRARYAGEAAQLDRFEQEHQSFFERIQAGYLARAQQYPQQFRLVDANQSLTVVQDQLKTHLDEFISKAKLR